MEDVLWYLFASSRGGETRARIVREIETRPQNANQLAETLDLDYTTVRHHLDVLMEDNVVRKSGDGYGDIYRLSEQTKHHWDTVEEILDTVSGENR